MDLLRTADAAARLGISKNTLGTWKSRYKDKFQEGVHYINQDSQLWWTESGLQLLEQLKAGNERAASSRANAPQAQNEPPAIADRYDPVVDALASAILPEIIQRLDRKILSGLKLTGENEITPEQTIEIIESLGLEAFDPLALIGGASDE